MMSIEGDSSADHWYQAEGEIVEVLSGFGVANILCKNGVCYVVNRATPGVKFDRLRAGMRLSCRVTKKFSRVLHACVVL